MKCYCHVYKNCVCKDIKYYSFIENVFGKYYILANIIKRYKL